MAAAMKAAQQQSYQGDYDSLDMEGVNPEQIAKLKSAMQGTSGS